MLHIVNKSPFQTSTLKTCLRMAQPGSAVLLIEDGVYGATQGTDIEAEMRQAGSSIKFGVTLVDYGGFVDLTLQYSTAHSWL